MNRAVYAGDLTAAQLTDLVTSLRPESPHAVLERVDDITFPGPSDPLDPTAWNEGRIFGPGLELHWVQQGEGFRAVLTREDGEDGAGLQQIETLVEYEREEHSYFLWGEDDRRIGRLLDYRSIPGKGRAQVVAAEFCDDAGELRHWRYVRFKREDDE